MATDDRNYLFEHMVGAALELKPRLFLMENVPGMKSPQLGRKSFLERAEAILVSKGGYQTAIWKLMPRPSASRKSVCAIFWWPREVGVSRRFLKLTTRHPTKMRSRWMRFPRCPWMRRSSIFRSATRTRARLCPLDIRSRHNRQTVPAISVEVRDPG